VGRFVTIWFPHLLTDWFELRGRTGGSAFVLVKPVHGRMVITTVNPLAAAQGVNTGMALADARVFIPSLEHAGEPADLAEKLLNRIAEWCIRYTPVVAIDPPAGLIFDASGCAHLWGGEEEYVTEIINRFKQLGYTARAAMADTAGAAWAFAHFGENRMVIAPGQHITALIPLPPAALRLDEDTVQRLVKLGLRQIGDFIAIPRPALHRRFGPSFILRLDQAIGHEREIIHPVHPVEPYQERLPCLDPIVTRTGIEIALERLLQTMIARLQEEEKGLRKAVFKCYRMDGKTMCIQVGTNRPSCNVLHLLKLFESKIGDIEPGPGIELFILEAPLVDDMIPVPVSIWKKNGGLADNNLSELLDRLATRIGNEHIHRYLPAEHYWPERSTKPSSSLDEQATIPWRCDRPRPIQLLSKPERIEVTAPIPDYPPMLFRYKGKLHKILKADGPERIEQEWWLQQGQHRDYYRVEDEEGNRYWLFRSGHYNDTNYQWFVHGFFA
jgi:protein ImuB